MKFNIQQNGSFNYSYRGSQKAAGKVRLLEQKIEDISTFIVDITTNRRYVGIDDPITNAELSRILNISERTLLRLRKNNLINYEVSKGRVTYKPSDVDKAIRDLLIRCDDEVVEEFRKNFIFVKQ